MTQTPSSYSQISTSDDFLVWIRANLNSFYPLNRITKDMRWGETGIRPGMAVSVGANGEIYKTDISDPASVSSYLGIVESWQDSVYRVVVSGHCYIPGIGWSGGDVYNIDSTSYLTTGSPSGTIKIALGIETDGIIVISNSGSSGGGGGSVTNIATSTPITGGPITSTGTIGITQATTGTDGYLSSIDWNTFNNKQATGNYITDLTGDVTASGPGSVTAALSTVNSNIGSFGSGAQVAVFTVNGKGLITAASNTSIQIAESQVTDLISDLALKAPLASPALTGIPTAPTASANNNSTQIATTAYVDNAAVDVDFILMASLRSLYQY